MSGLGVMAISKFKFVTYTFFVKITPNVRQYYFCTYVRKYLSIRFFFKILLFSNLSNDLSIVQ